MVIYGSVSNRSSIFSYYLNVDVLQQSVSDNASQVRIQSVLKTTNTAYQFDTVSTRDLYLTIDGSEVLRESKRIDCNPWTSNPYVVQEWIGWISHENNGQKQFSVSGYVNGSAGNYGPGACQASGSVSLPQIPRKSTVTATNAEIGTASTIVINKADSAFLHTVRYQFSGTQNWINIAVKTDQSVIGWVVPESAYSLIPNAPSIRCTVRCETFSAGVSLGTSDFELTAFCSASQCAPQISASATDVNPDTLALTGSSSVIVRGESNLRVQSSFTAKHGATIGSSVVSSGDGRTFSGNDVTIPDAESSSVSVQCTDSRGFSSSYPIPGLSVVPYLKPTLNLQVSRHTSTDGVLNLKGNGIAFFESFGNSENTVSVKYRYKEKNGEFGNYADIPITSQAENYSFEMQISGFDYRKEYEIEAVVSDCLNSVSVSDILRKGTPLFDWGESDFRFHIPLLLDRDPDSDDGAVRKSYVDGRCSGAVFYAMCRGPDFSYTPCILQKSGTKLTLECYFGNIDGQDWNLCIFSPVDVFPDSLILKKITVMAAGGARSVQMYSTFQTMINYNSIWMDLVNVPTYMQGDSSYPQINTVFEFEIGGN